MFRYLPNTLTILRMLGAPGVVLLYFRSPWGALLLYVLAAGTDLLDGKLARHLGVESRLGEWLDPIADKTLVLSVMWLLVYEGPLATALLLCGVTVISLREVGVVFMRAKAYFPVSLFSKWKTAAQMSSLGVLLTPAEEVLFLGQVLFGIAASMSAYSLWGYRGAILALFSPRSEVP